MATAALVAAAFFQLSLRRTPERDWGRRDSDLEVLRERLAPQGVPTQVTAAGDNAESVPGPREEGPPHKINLPKPEFRTGKGAILKPCIFPREASSSRGLALFKSGHLLLLARYALGYFYAAI